MSIMVTGNTVADARQQFEKNKQLQATQETRGFLCSYEKHAFMAVMTDTKEQRVAQVERLVNSKNLSRYEGILNQLGPNLRNFTVPFHFANEILLAIPKYERRKAKAAEMEMMKEMVRKQKEKEEKEKGKSELNKTVAEAIKGIKIVAMPPKPCISKKGSASKKKRPKVSLVEQPKFNTFYTDGNAA